MRLEDCTPGRRVTVAGRFLLTQLNSIAEVVQTRPAPARLENNPAYPYGMVQIRLSDRVDWPVREPWIGPEDLGFAPDDVAWRPAIPGETPGELTPGEDDVPAPIDVDRLYPPDSKP